LSSIRILALTRYGDLGPSSRLRFLQYLPYLKEQGFGIDVQPLFESAVLARRYARGSYSIKDLAVSWGRRIGSLLSRKKFDLLWIEKEALPWFPISIEQRLLSVVPYVVDLDDAIFHNYDLHRSQFVRKTLGLRTDSIMANSAMTIGGNQYLLDRASAAGARRIAMLPTVVDLSRYELRERNDGSDPVIPKIVWIGSPSTSKYLELLREPLNELAKRHAFSLRIVGGDWSVDSVPTEVVSWDLETEASDIATCDIGVMPLADSPWERGKCGYKLIQYMASGLPVVASPVGVNNQIVIPGHNGFLARDAVEWVACLERLILEPALRSSLGRAGRRRVEEHYCLQVTAPQLSRLLSEAAQRT